MGDQKLLFRSDTYGESITHRLFELGGNIQRLIKINPPKDPEVGFYAAFDYDPNVKYQLGDFAAIKPRLLLEKACHESTPEHYQRSQKARASRLVNIS